MKKSLLNQALHIAHSKLDNHPEYENYLHYSFVIQGNKIVEWGTNNSKTPPVHFGYASRMSSKRYRPKSHSEVEAFRHARGLLDFCKPFEMINIRLTKKGVVRLSKPCSCCYNLLKAMGCRKFYYSSNVGFLNVN